MTKLRKLNRRFASQIGRRAVTSTKNAVSPQRKSKLVLREYRQLSITYESRLRSKDVLVEHRKINNFTLHMCHRRECPTWSAPSSHKFRLQRLHCQTHGLNKRKDHVSGVRNITTRYASYLPATTTSLRDSPNAASRLRIRSSPSNLRYWVN